MGRGAFSPWHIVLFAVVILVLFGAGKLPGFARSLGQSMRIFKAEAKAMKDDDNLPVATPPGQISAMTQMPVVQPTASPVVQPVATPVVQSIATPVVQPLAPIVEPVPPAAVQPLVQPLDQPLDQTLVQPVVPPATVQAVQPVQPVLPPATVPPATVQTVAQPGEPVVPPEAAATPRTDG